VRKLGRLNRGLDGFFHRPAVGDVYHVQTRGNFHDHAVDAGVDGTLNVFFHAARKAEDLRSKIALDDGLDGLGVRRRHDRHAGFDAVHTGFGQTLGDANLVVLGHDDAGLLLAVAQGDVVNLDVLGEFEIFGHVVSVIPFADEPVIGLPRGSCHEEVSLLVSGDYGRHKE
jgi:hypothetical protein